MSLQQGILPRTSSNGFNRRRFDKEGGTRVENKMHSVKSVNGGKIVPICSPSRDRLIYVSSCLIGLHVEVHVKNGSVISGIFSAMNANDFGIVLRMAQIIKDGSSRGQKITPEVPKRPQTMIIPAREFVQIIAKDVPLTSDEFSTANASEKQKDLMIDSAISQSHNFDVERELERWTPDVDDPECPELENIFDGTWNRNWDQFETNKTLFGVKSTFNEELYTTKLERGPQMKNLEKEASRIAREIEGEETNDLHLAEERGIHFHEGFDIDEEIRYSAVHRQIDNGRSEENGDPFSEACNSETFGETINSEISRSYSDISRDKMFDEAQTPLTYSSMDEALSKCPSDNDVYSSGNNSHTSPSASDDAKKCSSAENEISVSHQHVRKPIEDQNENKSHLNARTDKVSFEAHISKSEDLKVLVNKKGLSPPAISYDSSSFHLENEDSSQQSSDLEHSSKMAVCSEPANQCPVVSTSFTSEHAAADPVSSGPSLSPSSSMGSLSSEKSTLNPNAKEFKLNPNAKSFMPSSTLRPSLPLSESSFYYTSTVPAVPHVQSLPMGVGIGPSFGAHQPVYNPHAPQLQTPHPYIHANGSMYGQQMIVGQPRPFYYMSSYPPDTHRGRNF